MTVGTLETVIMTWSERSICSPGGPVKQEVLGNPQSGPSHRSKEEAIGS